MPKIQAGELNTNYQRLPPSGPRAEAGGPAPVVVFIHGLLYDSLASYYFTLGPAFAAEGMDVIMYDLRGHGRSDRPAEGYQLEKFVADLDALLDVLEVDRPVHLIGNSFGGTIAYAYAAAHPDRSASVTAIECEPPVPVWSQHILDGLTDAKDRLARDEVLEWISTQHGVHTGRLSKAAGRLLAVTSMAEDIPASQTIEDDLSALRAPVLALFGDESGLAAQVDNLHAKLAVCRTVVLPDQGHSVLVEKTGETRDLILDWVREHSGHELVEAE